MRHSGRSARRVRTDLVDLGRRSTRLVRARRSTDPEGASRPATIQGLTRAPAELRTPAAWTHRSEPQPPRRTPATANSCATARTVGHAWRAARPPPCPANPPGPGQPTEHGGHPDPDHAPTAPYARRHSPILRRTALFEYAFQIVGQRWQRACGIESHTPRNRAGTRVEHLGPFLQGTSRRVVSARRHPREHHRIPFRTRLDWAHIPP